MIERRPPSVSPNISRHFKPCARDAIHAAKLIELEGTPEAIRYLDSVQNELSHYMYWYALSTCWVRYSGWSDLNLWRRLFSSRRPNRAQCLMKPNEYDTLQSLPEFVEVYRAHRPTETDWIAYTFSLTIAMRFARERGVTEVKRYRVRREDVLALFLRRNEQEVIVLDPTRAEWVSTHRRLDVLGS